MKAKVGDVIRALDFPGNNTCYMLGRVTAVHDEQICFRVFETVWEGNSKPCNEEMVTVQNGNHFLDSKFPGRITVL